jgi:hypothetical protein
MAGVHITSGTTVANTVSRLTFGWFRGIEVENRSTGDMWARFDGIDPTIAGDDCFFIAANSALSVNNPKVSPQVGSGITCAGRCLIAQQQEILIRFGTYR